MCVSVQCFGGLQTSHRCLTSAHETPESSASSNRCKVQESPRFMHTRRCTRMNSHALIHNACAWHAVKKKKELINPKNILHPCTQDVHEKSRKIFIAMHTLPDIHTDMPSNLLGESQQERDRRRGGRETSERQKKKEREGCMSLGQKGRRGGHVWMCARAHTLPLL